VTLDDVVTMKIMCDVYIVKRAVENYQKMHEAMQEKAKGQSASRAEAQKAPADEGKG
jgi:hypothetical protein